MEDFIMKDENVKKINTLGKVSKIILIIVQVFIIIAFVACIVGSIIVLAIPNDSIRINGQGTLNISVDSDLLEKGLVSMEESNVKLTYKGIDLRFTGTEKDSRNGETTYVFEASALNLTAREFKTVSVMGCLAGALVLACFYVVSVFGKKLSKALEKCNSPFEENVIKAMKAFGISMIPWAVMNFVIGRIDGLIVVFMVIIVLVFISVFKHGAKLQQESDETL